MVQYKLCLLYSSRNYLPLLNKTFTSFEEIDEYTTKFASEKALRESNVDNLKDKIISIMDTNYRYIQAIKSTEARNGKIVIVSIEENNEISYIKPLYKINEGLSSPKRLINSITGMLKEENNIPLLDQFLRKFNDNFMTTYNIYTNHLPRLKKDLTFYHNTSPETEREITCYKKILSIIKETLKIGYSKECDSISEDKKYKLRLMHNYLEQKIKDLYPEIDFEEKRVPKRKNKNNHKETQSTFLKQDHSKKNEFIAKVIKKAYDEGREDALLDFMFTENEMIYDKFFKAEEESKTKKL